jgi:hypothetical protein
MEWKDKRRKKYDAVVKSIKDKILSPRPFFNIATYNKTLTQDTEEETSRNTAQNKELSSSLTTGEVIRSDSPCSVVKRQREY